MKTLVHLIFTSSDLFSLPLYWPFRHGPRGELKPADRCLTADIELRHGLTIAACRIGIKAAPDKAHGVDRCPLYPPFSLSLPLSPPGLA